MLPSQLASAPLLAVRINRPSVASDNSPPLDRGNTLWILWDLILTTACGSHLSLWDFDHSPTIASRELCLPFMLREKKHFERVGKNRNLARGEFLLEVEGLPELRFRGYQSSAHRIRCRSMQSYVWRMKNKIMWVKCECSCWLVGLPTAHTLSLYICSMIKCSFSNVILKRTQLNAENKHTFIRLFLPF